MGQYAQLLLSRHPSQESVRGGLNLYESKNYVGLLWLACFRQDDIGDIQNGSYLSCEVGKARRQFEEGIEILRKTFPDTNFDGPTTAPDGADNEKLDSNPTKREIPEKLPGESYVDRFRRTLKTDGWDHVILAYGELCMYGEDYATLIKRALIGFDHPEIWFLYEKGMDDILKAAVPESGAMKWCQVLRLLCGRGRPFPGDLHEHPTELFRTVAGSQVEKDMLLGWFLGICL